MEHLGTVQEIQGNDAAEDTRSAKLSVQVTVSRFSEGARIQTQMTEKQ